MSAPTGVESINGVTFLTGVEGVTEVTSLTGVESIIGVTSLTGVSAPTGVESITGVTFLTGVMHVTGVASRTGVSSVRRGGKRPGRRNSRRRKISGIESLLLASGGGRVHHKRPQGISQLGQLRIQLGVHLAVGRLDHTAAGLHAIIGG